MPRLTLLLLSGGGHTGSNIMATLAARRADLRVVATSDRPDEPALFAFDAAYLAPPLADTAAFEQRIQEILDQEAPRLIIPCRDDDAVWLAGLRERRPEIAPACLCGDQRLAVVINDKWLSFEFARAHGLPFAPSLACGEHADVTAFIAQHRLPMVAKPRHGSDSRDVVLVIEAAQAQHWAARPGYVLQQYLGQPDAIRDLSARLEAEGIPMSHSLHGVKRSMQVLIAPNGDIEHVICTRNQMIGRIARSVAVDDDRDARDIGERCARVFAAEGWRGPLNVQCQPAADGRLLIHEFNARFTGATAARLAIGFDEVGAAIRSFTGQQIAVSRSWQEPPKVAFESLSARSADDADVRALATSGRWSPQAH